MMIDELRIRYADIAMLGGQVMRVAIEMDEAAEAAALTISLGWKEGSFTAVDTLRLPASVIGELRAALALLEDG